MENKSESIVWTARFTTNKWSLSKTISQIQYVGVLFDSNENTESNGKPLFECPLLGHVDSGKSTILGNLSIGITNLMILQGRLLVDLGVIPKHRVDEMRKNAIDMGKRSFQYSYIANDFTNKTQPPIETLKRRINFQDSPGMRDFVKTMISNLIKVWFGFEMNSA